MNKTAERIIASVFIDGQTMFFFSNENIPSITDSRKFAMRYPFRSMEQVNKMVSAFARENNIPLDDISIEVM